MRRTIGSASVATNSRSWYSRHQIFTYSFFILQNVVYEMWEGKWQELSILKMSLEIWHYVLVAFIVWELKAVRGCDTRDPILKGLSSQSQFQECELSYCVMCNSIVLKTSYHCWKCNQCSDNIDHHCKYLNCCISEENYMAFLRLLTVFIFYNADYLLVIAGRKDVDGVLIWSIVAGSTAELGLSLGLLGFHAYLKHCRGDTTKDFCLRKTATEGMDGNERQNSANIT